MAEYNNTISTQSYDNLIGGTAIPLLTKVVIIASGEGKLAKGTVLGKITASGKYRKVNSANDDGSQVANLVLRDAADATAVDVKTVAYIQGIFNREALIFGSTDTAVNHEAALRDVNIILTGRMD